MISSRRVGIVFDNFGPYHVARLVGAAAYLDVVAIEVAPSRSEYGWDRPILSDAMRYVALDGPRTIADAQAHRTGFCVRGALPVDGLDAIALPGWSSVAALTMLAQARSADVPAILMSETNGWDFRRRAVSEAVKRAVVAHFTAALVTSDSQAEYLVSLGLPAAAIFRGYNTIDNAYFASEARQRADRPLPGVEGKPLPEGARGRYFLTSNRFIEKKNLPRLLRAYAAFRRSRGDDPADWPLVLMGDGEQRALLTALRTTLGLERHVHFAGFRQIDELPSFYATAGAFVHASTTEQWGLVVNEAMASGLLVAVSSRCGCAEVLVTHGETGFVFDPFDEDRITAVLRTLADADTAQRARLVQASKDRIAAWGPARFGQGLGDATAFATAADRIRPGLAARLGLMLATRQRAIASMRLREPK